MAKAKVLIPFTDRITKKRYKKGDIITVTAERFNEISKAGNFIALVDDEKTTKA